MGPLGRGRLGSLVPEWPARPAAGSTEDKGRFHPGHRPLGWPLGHLSGLGWNWELQSASRPKVSALPCNASMKIYVIRLKMATGHTEKKLCSLRLIHSFIDAIEESDMQACTDVIYTGGSFSVKRTQTNKEPLMSSHGLNTTQNCPLTSPEEPNYTTK